MKLYFMRHGEAMSPSVFPGDDHLRPLTDQGKKQVASISATVAKEITEVEYLLSSPFLRARQTMEIIKNKLKTHPEYMELDLLSPDNNHFKQLLGYLMSLNSDSVFITGHQPQIEGFMKYLVSEHAEIHLDIGTASFHCVEIIDKDIVDPGTGVLKFSTPSHIMRTD